MNLILRLLETISQKRTYKKQEVHVSASIGGAIYPDDAKTAEQLMKCADEAMYKAKKSGKKSVRFFQES